MNTVVQEAERCDPWESLRFFPSLAVRHAGSAILQEVNFEFIRIPLPGSDNLGPLVRGVENARRGAHFTPPSLARRIVESSLAEIGNLRDRKDLAVLDPACGTGTFLQETVRTLRRMGYAGRLRLIGRDISAPSILMSRFAVERAVADWAAEHRVDIDLKTSDSLDERLPKVDVVLMNPPFLAWWLMNSRQRDQVRGILNARERGDIDLSMAFVISALNSLDDGGVLGAMLPADLLTLQSARRWRREVAERGHLRLLGSMGNYDLIVPGGVDVAMTVITKGRDGHHGRDMFRTVFCDDFRAREGALRMLRKNQGRDKNDSSNGKHWWISDTPTEKMESGPIWRVSSPDVERRLARLREDGASTVSELFEIKRGIRTGDDEAFILSGERFSKLPMPERKFFRRAVMNDSVHAGRVDEEVWVFYPYGDPKIAIADEKSLRHALPTYFEKYLTPREKSLKQRSNSKTRSNWWDISENRISWILDEMPRIISKRRGGRGNFIADLAVEFIPVQGFAWFPSWKDDEGDGNGGEFLSCEDIVRAYFVLLNSTAFSKVLMLYSPWVRNEGFEISSEYIADAVVPNLSKLARDPNTAREIFRLVELGREPSFRDRKWNIEVDRISAMLYGVDFFEEH